VRLITLLESEKKHRKVSRLSSDEKKAKENVVDTRSRRVRRDQKERVKINQKNKADMKDEGGGKQANSSE